MDSLDKDVVNLTKAIRQVESGGKFDARSKDGSYGAYQFIKPTWDATSKKYGVNAEWEKATPEQQNEVAYKQIKEWKDKGYNVGQIASMWNAGAGRPNAYKEGLSGVNKSGVAYNVAKYAEKVATNYHKIKGTTQEVPPASEVEQPVEQPKTGMEKVGGVLDTIFGGGKIGELFGSASVRNDIRDGGDIAGNKVIEADYSKLSPQAIARLKAKGVPTTAQAQREEIAQMVDSPTGMQLAGDVARIGLNFLPAGAIAKGGAKAIPLLNKAPKIIGNIVEGAGITGLANTASNVANERPLTENLGTSLALGGVIGGVVPPLLSGASNVVKKVLQPAEKKLESKVLDQFKKGVKPLINTKMTNKGAEKYDDNIISGVKTIKDNKANLSFTDDVGETITGQTPKTLQQFADSIEQTKKVIFKGYDDLAKTAGKAGVKVDMKPIANELDTIINNKALGITNPTSIKYAKQLQSRLLSTGNLDATTAQDVIQNYNKSLEAFYRNPSYETATQASIDAMIANNMRKALDEGISGLTGAEYGALKKQYGALKAIEKDVIKASLRDARKNTKGLIDFTDIFSGGQVVNGILSLNPAQIGSGLAQKGIASFYKYLNNPNRAIEKLFASAEKLPTLKLPIKPKPSLRLGETPKTREIIPDFNLTGQDAKIQNASIAKYKANPQKLTEEYIKANGKVVNTDEARKLFKDVGYKGSNSPAVQEASSAVAKDAWQELLKTSEATDSLIYAGGSGTGKTSAVKNILSSEVENAGAILDGNLSTMKSAKARIQESLDAGKHPTVVYVYRDPVDSWINGVIKRMKGNAEEGGRIVPLSIFAENHKGSYEVVKQLLQKDGLKYDVKLVDNSLGKGNQRLLDRKKFDNIKYNDNLEKELRDVTKKLYEDGQITKTQYEALIK